jgi:hypothetical protein
VFQEISRVLKGLAANLAKVARDISLLSSGIRAGLMEMSLPAVQAGSSSSPARSIRSCRPDIRQGHRDHAGRPGRRTGLQHLDRGPRQERLRILSTSEGQPPNVLMIARSETT